jgi:hypothetical protein
VVSAKGALNSGEFTPVTGNFDATPGGDGTVDPNNLWEITSTLGGKVVFSEESQGTEATLTLGEQFVLSDSGGWVKSLFEDLKMEVVLADGTVALANVEFFDSGPNQPFTRSDLNFNRDLDAGDWDIFRNNHRQSLAGLSIPESYQLGDLDGDGDNDFADFRMFQADYIAANGAAAFDALVGAVPEPGSIFLALVSLAGISLMRFQRRAIRVA